MRNRHLRGGKNRNRHCFYPGCRSGYPDNPEKISIFGTPIDKNLFEQWKKIVPRADRVLHEHDCICEKHFRKEDVIREWVSGGYITIPLKVPRLRVGALPSPDLSDLRLVETKVAEKPKPIIIRWDPYPTKKRTINEKNLKTTTAVNNKTLKTNMETETEAEEVQALFADPLDEIVNKINSIKLPTGWGVHLLPDNILLTECLIIHGSEPVTLRQIVIDKTLTYKLFYSTTPVTTVTTLNEIQIKEMEDIERLIDLFVRTYFCVGGPRTKFYPPSDMNMKLGHPDLLGVWRHIMCSTVVSRPSSACIYCSSLHGKFVQKAIKIEKPAVDNRSIKRLKTENQNLKIQIRNLKKDLDVLLNSQPSTTPIVNEV